MRNQTTELQLEFSDAALENKGMKYWVSQFPISFTTNSKICFAANDEAQKKMTDLCAALKLDISGGQKGPSISAHKNSKAFIYQVS